MHIVFVHFNFLIKNQFDSIYNDITNNNIRISIIQRSNINSNVGNKYLIKDEFDKELRWWQNPEKLNEFIGELNPNLVYIFGLNLPLQFRWLRQYLTKNTILIAQYCGEDIWIQKNLWLQQFGLRVVNGFVFTTKHDAYTWQKCAAILDSQPVYEINEFKNEMADIYSNLLKIKTVSD